MTMYLRLLLSAFVLSIVVSTDVPNQCPDPSDPDAPPYFFYGHPDDCTHYFQCSFGDPILQECYPGSRWSNELQTCAGINSYYDTCTRENAVRECDRGGLNPALIPHPTACQRYYNCSAASGFYESECQYPEIFDVNDKTCKDFHQATCAFSTTPALDPCDYTISVNRPCGCSRAHCAGCIPCYVNWPSCVGFEDGLNAYRDREWTPYYVRCDTQRMVEKLYCGTHAASGFQGIFSPIKRTCVSLWEVPKDKGGYQSTCDGKAPGQYRVEDGPPHIYYSCPNEEVHFCQIGQYFKDNTQQCDNTGP